jgi:hypothetical protein
VGERVVNLSNTGSDMEIIQKISNRYRAMDANVGMYMSDGNTGGWMMVRSKYDSATGTYTHSSKRLATFGLISVQAPGTPAGDYSTQDALVKIHSKINLVDFTGFNANQPIHANHFNLLVWAISKNQLSVNLNTPISDAQVAELGKANMLISGANIPLDAGLRTLVRLYENKIGQVKGVKGHMDKAEMIGFLDIFNDVDPNKLMTHEEMFYMLDIIIDDGGF